MEKIPKAIGPYSLYRRAGQLLFTSGQLPINPDTNRIDALDSEGQIRQSLKNIQSIMINEGGSLKNVIKVKVLLSDLKNFEIANNVFEEFFSEPYPSRTVFEVSKLPNDSLVEIEAIAYLEK